MTYPRIVPLGSFLGWSDDVRRSVQNTVLRNQPYAGRNIDDRPVSARRTAYPTLTPRRATASPARLRGCDSGLAFVEFAMSLPVLLTLGLVGLETANYAMAHLRVSNIAMLTADNAARVRDIIDEADVIELLTGAKMTGDNINFAPERPHHPVRASSPTRGRRHQHRPVDPLAALRRRAQLVATPPTLRPRTAAARRSPTAPKSTLATGRRPPRRAAARRRPSPAWAPTDRGAGGTAVMVVEVVYDYQPIVSEQLLRAAQIRYESAFNVRQRTDQALSNAGTASRREELQHLRRLKPLPSTARRRPA